MTARHWHPFDWRAPVGDIVSRIREGDVVHNPVHRKDNDATRELAERVDEALATRGLKLDHAQFYIGFVERAEKE